jgi:hypothetical protein
MSDSKEEIEIKEVIHKTDKKNKTVFKKKGYTYNPFEKYWFKFNVSLEYFKNDDDNDYPCVNANEIDSKDFIDLCIKYNSEKFEPEHIRTDTISPYFSKKEYKIKLYKFYLYSEYLLLDLLNSHTKVPRKHEKYDDSYTDDKCFMCGVMCTTKNQNKFYNAYQSYVKLKNINICVIIYCCDDCDAIVDYCTSNITSKIYFRDSGYITIDCCCDRPNK